MPCHAETVEHREDCEQADPAKLLPELTKGQAFPVSMVAATTAGRYSGIPSVMASRLMYSLSPTLELKLYLQNLDFQGKKRIGITKFGTPKVGEQTIANLNCLSVLRF